MIDKKYLFYLNSLDLTGGVKVSLDIINGLLAKGYQVDILLDKSIIKFNISENINIYYDTLLCIEKMDSINNSLSGETENITKRKITTLQKAKRLVLRVKAFKVILIWLRYIMFLLKYPFYYFRIKKFLRKSNYNLIISTNMYNNLEYLFALERKKTILVLHNSPKNVYLDRITPHLLPLKYYFNDIECIGVSKEIINEMRSFINEKRTTLQTIYNPFYIEKIKKLSEEKIEKKYDNVNFFIMVGGLNYRKRIDRAILAFSKLKDKDIKLILVGKGEESDYLHKIVLNHKLNKRVLFIGPKLNPYKYISKSKGLLLTSDSEGLPTVLIESLICNTAVISTDCPTGPNEILVGKLSSFLISMNNENQIIDKLVYNINILLKNEIEIKISDYSKFDANNILQQWEKTLNEKIT